MNEKFRHIPIIAIAVPVLCFMFTSCARFSHTIVPVDRFNYNEAISRSQKEQMLLNILRLRYRDIPVFLSVASILTQYSYTGSIGASGTAVLDTSTVAASNIGGSANFGYTERPTITYIPLTGSEFARRIFSPIPVELMFGASQGGYATDLLMLIGLQRLNDLENSSFAAVPSPDDLDRLREFSRVLNLTNELGSRGALEMYRDKKETTALRYLVVAENLDSDTQALVNEFRKSLGLDPDQNTYRLTARLTKRDPDEITVHPRSLIGVMSFLSRGVEIPAAHLKEGRVVDMGSWGDMVSFRILSSRDRPGNVFVAVRYQDYWFYIENSDHESKRAFGLLIYLFQLQAPEKAAAAPILTLPTGP